MTTANPARSSNVTRGRCRPCGKAYEWPKHCARLGDMRCPDCGGYLAQTTRYLKIGFRPVDGATARRIAGAVIEARDAERARRLAMPGAKLARDLAVGDVVSHHAARELLRITETETYTATNTRDGIMARGDHVYARPGGALRGTVFYGADDVVFTFPDDDVARHVRTREHESGANAVSS